MERIKRVEELLSSLKTTDSIRIKNKKRVCELFEELGLHEKVVDCDELFSFVAINLMGISLQKETLGEVQPKRYVQIIGIKKSEKGTKNINLRYFGRAEFIEEILKDKIVEFVLRWRLEKSFMSVDHYKDLLGVKFEK
ncbi:hypothetical protein NitYY0826_C1119 [Nitratiruptor sp. YY08-26]|uniref:hypothetical protein n=1 Tax=unclassified Nitratiruptor TaxID=2624044 RepID=UPI0019161BD7|nr:MULTISPECIES: hypothetical protein [unclassified Nitratiruptor]BCD62243.1 hypothetical protein NitYY0813_C1117 [Nitratiruptor sp. YY08-13]BCD66179.1 hypothetical protein NitYY0826_C1119 [Nitratiruptor sp. YY08-26]